MLQGQKKPLTKQTTISVKAHEASYEVEYLIAQTRMAHTIGETFTKLAAIATIWILFVLFVICPYMLSIFIYVMMGCCLFVFAREFGNKIH